MITTLQKLKVEKKAKLKLKEKKNQLTSRPRDKESIR